MMVIKMGMFCSIYLYQECPYCKKVQHFEAQTKDLRNALDEYVPLPDDWFKSQIERKFRLGLPVFPQFPMDKEHTVWKNQAERTEAQATVPKEFSHLKFVSIIADCHSIICQAWADKRDQKNYGYVSGFGRQFRGKIKIHKGMLMGKIYDIELSDKSGKK